MLKFISRQFETNNAGPGTISKVSDDPGGKSYGVYQLSEDTLLEYLKVSVFKPTSEVFSRGFDLEWEKFARDNPTKFTLDQHVFIFKKLYTPNITLAGELGFSVDSRKIQEAIFSIAVQHGGAAKIIRYAVASGKSTDNQVRALYEARVKYVKDLNLTPRLKEALFARYMRELQAVLKIAEQ